MVGNIVLGAIVKAAAERGVKGLADLVGLARQDDVKIATRHSRRALLDHLTMVESWSQELSFRGTLVSRTLRDCSTRLTLRQGDLREREQGGRASLSVEDLLNASQSFVILGRPGAGKSTSLQQIAGKILSARLDGVPVVPVLARLRLLRDSEGLFEYLLNELGIALTFPPGASRDSTRLWSRRALTQYLDTINAVLLLDGLDEVPLTQLAQVRRDAEELLLHSLHLRLLLTCRLGAFDKPIARTHVVTVRPLEDSQIRDIASKWLGDEGCRDFLAQLTRTPILGAEVLPLALVQLCAIYERSGAIPPRPSEVYELLVRLFIEEWDLQKDVIRRSRYAYLSTAAKERLLRAVAYQLTVDGHRGVFTSSELEAAYISVCDDFSLPFAEARIVAKELESHTGLLIQSGSDQFEFSHRTYQEYLAASYLLSLSDCVRMAVPSHPEELAVAVALSPRPNGYLEQVFEATSQDSISREFVAQFLSRLSVERANFRPNEKLGWTLLALLGELFRTPATRDPMSAITSNPTDRTWIAVEAMMQDVRIAASVFAALSRATQDDSRLGYSTLRIVYNPEVIALSVYKKLDAARPKGVVMPTTLLRRVHELASVFVQDTQEVASSAPIGRARRGERHG